MSGTTPYAQCTDDVADTCREAAAEIGARLDLLRAHLTSIDPETVDMRGARLADLLAGYDIYTRMLEDALHDIAGNLERAALPARRSEVELAGGSPW